MKENRLKIHALNLNDLNLISAYLQDAICPTSDILNLKRNRIFIMQLNRFMWENLNKNVSIVKKRIRTILKFEGVLAVSSKNITNQKRGEFFEFLTIESKKMPDKNYEMKIIFAGNSIIKIIAEMIDVKLDDQGTPWDSKLKPKHNL